jgi:hypothetical protein
MSLALVVCLLILVDAVVPSARSLDGVIDAIPFRVWKYAVVDVSASVCAIFTPQILKESFVIGILSNETNHRHNPTFISRSYGKETRRIIQRDQSF